jgi:membrane protein required for colicin V production
MNQIDLIILIIAALGAVQGVFKGFILSATSLLGLILGFYISLRFGWYIEAILQQSTGSDSSLMHLLAFGICYLLVIVVMYFIGKAIQKMLEMASLGCLNRMSGAIFGAFKGLLLVSALIYVIEIADKNSLLIKPEKKEASVLYKPIEQLVPSMVPQVKKGLERLKLQKSGDDSETEEGPMVNDTTTEGETTL